VRYWHLEEKPSTFKGVAFSEAIILFSQNMTGTVYFLKKSSSCHVRLSLAAGCEGTNLQNIIDRVLSFAFLKYLRGLVGILCAQASNLLQYLPMALPAPPYVPPLEWLGLHF